MKISNLQEIENKKTEIIELYEKSYSVSEVLQKLNLKERHRKNIVILLKERGIYQGVGGKSSLYKQHKIQNTMLEKYGVINAGQIPGNGWKHNSIMRTEIKFLQEYKNYCIKVDIITKSNAKKLIDTGFCHYTGIKFADSDKNTPTNPNDPLKRSVDHKISKWLGFILGMEPDIIGDVGNLVYCLKYCNSMKNNMIEESFAPYAQEIRKRLINEGFESN